MDGSPRVQTRSGAVTKASPKLPPTFWHILQWHTQTIPRGGFTR